jgi:ribonuclease P protein component
VATIWRLSEPAAFGRLQAARHRTRSGPLWVAWSAPLDASTPPRVAYAIGRRVGGAVVRNRLRRRLRAIVAEAAPPPGDYLIGVSPAGAELASSQLRARVTEALRALPPAAHASA